MIETQLGPAMPDSPMQRRPWVWGGDGIQAMRYQTDNTVIVQTDRSANVEFDDNTENQYIPPPP